jgi:hypothetical protein
MDDELIREIIINQDLDKLMNSIKTVEDAGASRKIIEYFENKGYDVKKYREIHEIKEKEAIARFMN